MGRQDVGQMDHLVGAPLWWHDNASDLLHLRIVCRADAIEITGNLDTSFINS